MLNLYPHLYHFLPLFYRCCQVFLIFYCFFDEYCSKVNSCANHFGDSTSLVYGYNKCRLWVFAKVFGASKSATIAKYNL